MFESPKRTTARFLPGSPVCPMVDVTKNDEETVAEMEAKSQKAFLLLLRSFFTIVSPKAFFLQHENCDLVSLLLLMSNSSQPFTQFLEPQHQSAQQILDLHPCNMLMVISTN